MQISQQLAAEGTKFNQSLAGSGAGAAGSSGNAGCNYDERYPLLAHTRQDHLEPV